jgi:hypothetical protein
MPGIFQKSNHSDLWLIYDHSRHPTPNFYISRVQKNDQAGRLGLRAAGFCLPPCPYQLFTPVVNKLQLHSPNIALFVKIIQTFSALFHENKFKFRSKKGF